MTNIQIEFSNSPNKLNPVVITRRVVNALIQLKLIKKKRNIFLSISFVSKVKMKTLNSKYRGKNSATDILSFEQNSKTQPKGVLFLGDIVICTEILKKQASQQNHSMYKEYSILITHGILHLLGYDHEKGSDDERKMELLERKILKKQELK